MSQTNQNDATRSQSKSTSPLHQFREFVAQRLQKVPYGWGGEAGYQLARKYGDLIEQYWLDGELVDDTAAAVHRLHMDRGPKKVTPVSRETLIAAGCAFTNLFTPTEAERERSERQGEAIEIFRREV